MRHSFIHSVRKSSTLSNQYVSVARSLENKERIDYKEIRFTPELGGECYDSVYLGVNIDDEMRNEIIEAAKNLNPNIKIYQMKADANAFKLQTEPII